MGAFKIGGRTVGACDGPSRDSPACFRTNATRKRLGCGDARTLAIDEMLTQTSPAALPAAIIEWLKTKLSDEDMEYFNAVLADGGAMDDTLGDFRAYLKQIGLNDDDIAKACELAAGGPAAEDDILTMPKAGKPRGAMDAAAKAFGERYAADWARRNGRKPVREPQPSAATLAADEARRKEMFPHMDRLKTDYAGYGQSQGGRPPARVPPRTAADEARFDAMFPDVKRLKQAV